MILSRIRSSVSSHDCCRRMAPPRCVMYMCYVRMQYIVGYERNSTSCEESMDACRVLHSSATPAAVRASLSMEACLHCCVPVQYIRSYQECVRRFRSVSSPPSATSAKQKITVHVVAVCASHKPPREKISNRRIVPLLHLAQQMLPSTPPLTTSRFVAAVRHKLLYLLNAVRDTATYRKANKAHQFRLAQEEIRTNTAASCRQRRPRFYLNLQRAFLDFES